MNSNSSSLILTIFDKGKNSKIESKLNSIENPDSIFPGEKLIIPGNAIF